MPEWVYSSEPVWHHLMRLENEVSRLQGKVAPHKLRCSRCLGQKWVPDSYPAWATDGTVVCPACEGKDPPEEAA